MRYPLLLAVLLACGTSVTEPTPPRPTLTVLAANGPSGTNLVLVAYPGGTTIVPSSGTACVHFAADSFVVFTYVNASNPNSGFTVFPAVSGSVYEAGDRRLSFVAGDSPC